MVHQRWRNTTRPRTGVAVPSYRAKKSRANAQKNPQRARSERARKATVRPESRSNAGRTVADERKLSPLARLAHTLQREKIRFLVVGGNDGGPILKDLLGLHIPRLYAVCKPSVPC